MVCFNKRGTGDAFTRYILQQKSHTVRHLVEPFRDGTRPGGDRAQVGPLSTRYHVGLDQRYVSRVLKEEVLCQSLESDRDRGGHGSR